MRMFIRQFDVIDIRYPESDTGIIPVTHQGLCARYA